MTDSDPWATEVATVVQDLRRRGGWSSSAFARQILAVNGRHTKTAAEEQRLDQYLPGWRSGADEQTLEELRIGVGSLPVLARARAAGYDIAADEEAAPLLDLLRGHADHLAPHHRAALAALTPVPDRRTRGGGAAGRVTAGSPPTHVRPTSPLLGRPVKEPKPPRATRRFKRPAPQGMHPLAGQWVRASNDLVSVEVYVVAVSDTPASVTVWTPTTGRRTQMPLDRWALVIIDDPRAPAGKR